MGGNRYAEVADKRSEAGAALFDKAAPSGWAALVPENFSMESRGRCVLAHVLGGYIEGLKILGLNDREDALAHGFCALFVDLGKDKKEFSPYYDALTKAWRRRIKERLP